MHLPQTSRAVSPKSGTLAASCVDYTAFFSNTIGSLRWVSSFRRHDSPPFGSLLKTTKEKDPPVRELPICFSLPFEEKQKGMEFVQFFLIPKCVF